MTEMRKFETGATRNVDDSKFDYEGFLSPIALRAFAEYMHKNRVQADGNLRASDNWQKGIPLDSYMKSMYRHFFSVWENHRGIMSDEDMVTSLSALMFNVQGYLHEYIKGKKINMQDVYIDRIDKSNMPIESKLIMHDIITTPLEHDSVMDGIDKLIDDGNTVVGDWDGEPITRPKTIGERYGI